MTTIPTRTIGKFKIHPLCDLYRDMDGQEWDEFLANVREQGVQEQPVMLDGMVLDGKNRIRAALECGFPVVTRNATPKEAKDPEAFVHRKNKHRRHLSPAERAMKGADIAEKHEGEGVSARKAVKKAAVDVGVSESAVWSARRIKDAAPEQAEAVRKGHKSISAAAKAMQEMEEQEDGTATEPAKPDPVLDHEGRAIPEKFRHVFTEGVEQFRAIESDLAGLRKKIKSLAESGETGAGAHLSLQRCNTNLTQLRDEMRQARPYSVCPTCAGKGCETCLSLGWVNKVRWDAAGEDVIAVFSSRQWPQGGGA